MSIFNENDRRLRKLNKIADKIEALAPKYHAMTDDELVAQTEAFKQRIQGGETLTGGTRKCPIITAFTTEKSAQA